MSATRSRFELPLGGSLSRSVGGAPASVPRLPTIGSRATQSAVAPPLPTDSAGGGRAGAATGAAAGGSALSGAASAPVAPGATGLENAAAASAAAVAAAATDRSHFDSDAVEDEPMEVLTGDDVVEFYARRGQDSGVKFFYCVPAPTGLTFRPYDLVVTTREEAHGGEYFTMSASGVVQIRPGEQSEFTQLGEWMRHKSIFNVLTRMRFFKHYLVYKRFKHWHKAVRRKLFRQVRNKLTRKLFLAKPTFCPALMELCGHVHELSEINMMAIAEGRLYNLDEFAELQVNQRSHRATPALEATVERIQHCLEKVCREVVKQAKLYQESIRNEMELEDFTGVNLYQGRDMDKKRSMVSIKQEKIERAQTYRRVSEEAKMLGDFIRLADYMLVEGLVGRTVNTAEQLLDVLEASRQKATDKVSKGVFLTTISFTDGGIDFSPDAPDVREVLSSNVIEGMIATVQAVPRLLYMRSFSHYFNGKFQGMNPVSIIRSTDYFAQVRSRIDGVISKDFAAAAEYVKNFDEHRPIYTFGKSWDFAAYKEREHSVAIFRADLGRQREWRNDLERMRIGYVLGVLHVDSKSLRNSLIPMTSRTLDDVKVFLLTAAREATIVALEVFRERCKILQERPTTLDEFVDFTELSAEMSAGKKEALAEAQEVDEMYDLLASVEMKVPTPDQVKHDDLREAVATFTNAIIEAETFIEERKQGMMATLDKNINATNEEMLAVLGNLHSGMYVDPEAKAVAVCEDLEELLELLATTKERAEAFADYQRLFGMQPDDFSNLSLTEKECNARYAVWKAMREWEAHTHEWSTGRVLALDIATVADTVDSYTKSAYKMSKANKDDHVVYRLKDAIDAFKLKLPLIEELANPAMRDRHWTSVFEIIGSEYKGAEVPFSVDDLLAQNIMDKLEAVQRVSTNASKEHSLEKALEKMTEDWDDVCFRVIAYKDTGTFIIGGVDEVQLVLDDQIVRVQSMRASPFIKPFEDRASTWEGMLQTLQDMIDQWLQCQKTWQYLEPIFGSEDIVQQLPEEGAMFKTVDAIWRDVMRKTNQKPECITIARDKERLARLEEANQLLDTIQKGLASYLEVKRVAFPRFFFLSNDEMLEILSETKDPKRVQPHLKKCFEGISTLEFTEEEEIIQAMVSAEKERFPLVEPINPAAARGAVEKWLLQVEMGMFAAVQAETAKAVEAYAGEKREDWVLAWPGQVVLVGSAIYWTSGCVEAIESGKLADFEKLNTSQLSDIVSLVRGNLSKLNRKTLSALVVMDVHARDVVAAMVKEGVAESTDFSWLSQLRMYWEERTAEQEGDGDHTCNIHMMNAEVEYGYEYLGNSSRLVITPLTDRCYRTLIGAIHLGMGGAPEGPAGTGKTETTKVTSALLTSPAGLACSCVACRLHCKSESLARVPATLADPLPPPPSPAGPGEGAREAVRRVQVRLIRGLLAGWLADYCLCAIGAGDPPLLICSPSLTAPPCVPPGPFPPQLLRHARLPGDGQVLQGARKLGRVGLLRRVQPHQPGGAERGGAAGAGAADRQAQQGQAVLLRGLAPDAQAVGKRLHHHEPRLRGPLRAARQPQGALPHGGDDGARLRDDRRDPAVLIRLLAGARQRAQDRGHLQAVLGAAVVPGPLRLRHARGDGGAAGGGQPEAQVPRGGRVRAHAALHRRRQPVQVPQPGRGALQRHHRRPFPWRRAARA